MDWIRWIYYYFMIYSGIADTYRYEQFIKKTNLIYDLEFLIFSCNLNSKDKETALINLMIVFTLIFCYISDKLKKLI